MRRHHNLFWISAALLTFGLTVLHCGSLYGEPVSGADIAEDEVQVADSSQLLPPGATETPESEAARKAAPKTWHSLSDGVKFAVAFFGILVLYVIVRALINRSRNREEIVIHRKDGPDGAVSPPRDGNQREDAGSGRRIPPVYDSWRWPNRGGRSPLPPSQPAPGDGSPGPSQKARKGSWVPLMILGLALINLIRQCIMRN